jgi:alkylation response protein AidB-like acyl-CoA dehydrogenase
MNFDYTEEQTLLAESVRRLVEKEYSFEARKKLLAGGKGDAASAASNAIWAQFAELGLLSIPLPSAYDGYGGGAVDLIGVMEAFGDGLVTEPYMATVILGARTIAIAGNDAQKRELLPKVSAGKLKLALAIGEQEARYNLAHCEMKATRHGNDWSLSGRKMVVLGAPEADKLIVVARVSGALADAAGLALFLVDRSATGVALTSYRTFDDLSAADITLSNVPIIEEVMDYANAVACAEAVGAMDYANKATLEYIKGRKQFGQPIGSFQALQHRMVDMTISATQARSMVYMACTSVNGEQTPAERGRRIAAVKIKVNDAARHVSQEAIQLHGGMGMTEELKISHTFRRLTMLARRFGDADYHLDRFITA